MKQSTPYAGHDGRPLTRWRTAERAQNCPNYLNHPTRCLKRSSSSDSCTNVWLKECRVHFLTHFIRWKFCLPVNKNPLFHRHVCRSPLLSNKGEQRGTSRPRAFIIIIIEHLGELAHGSFFPASGATLPLPETTICFVPLFEYSTLPRLLRGCDLAQSCLPQRVSSATAIIYVGIFYISYPASRFLRPFSHYGSLPGPRRDSNVLRRSRQGKAEELVQETWREFLPQVSS